MRLTSCGAATPAARLRWQCDKRPRYKGCLCSHFPLQLNLCPTRSFTPCFSGNPPCRYAVQQTPLGIAPPLSRRWWLCACCCWGRSSRSHNQAMAITRIMRKSTVKAPPGRRIMRQPWSLIRRRHMPSMHRSINTRRRGRLLLNRLPLPLSRSFTGSTSAATVRSGSSFPPPMRFSPRLASKRLLLIHRPPSTRRRRYRPVITTLTR